MPRAGSSYQIKRRGVVEKAPRAKRRKEEVLGLTDVRTDRSPSQDIQQEGSRFAAGADLFSSLCAIIGAILTPAPYSLFPIRSSPRDLLSYLTRPSLRSFRHV